MKKTQLIDYDVTCVIMGGGAGTRLSPLTQARAKPAVPLAGKFRLIDIPISNCINSGLTHIYILTQFNSTPLHRHISASYHFDRFSRGFVEILAAQQSPQHTADRSWYQGTADAVRKNLRRFQDTGGQDVLILSGDQIYRMDFRDILATHQRDEGKGKADVTIGSVVVPKDKARSLGILRTNAEGRVVAFEEKPGDDESRFAGLELSESLQRKFNLPVGDEPRYSANMGIYVFSIDVLVKALDNDFIDFGREVLPALLDSCQVRAHPFLGYWEDIGTIGAFHQANIDLGKPQPSFDFFDGAAPIYTRARLLPASRLEDVSVRSSLISDGCQVKGAIIEHSLIGLRSYVAKGVTIRSTYMMGADFYEDKETRTANALGTRPDLGIGEGTVVEGAIIDKDARIGRNVRLVNDAGHVDFDDEIIVIRDGIIVVPRGGTVPHGYTIPAKA